MVNIRSFNVHIETPVLTALQEKLRTTRWPDTIEDSGWEYGTSLPYMQSLADYWQHSFDWREVEAEINSYPNFIATINGYDIHFLHIKGKGKRSFPLILTHGWPGSFVEMLRIIPLLTEDPDYSFDLVIPSLLGYGFSQKVTTPGANTWLMADLWQQLMTALGYNKFGAQGGDLGAQVSTILALRYPQQVKGLHLNYIPGSFTPYLPEGQQWDANTLAYKKEVAEWAGREGAYFMMHATKPLTLAYGLQDSPVGLCAWIVEKFNSWSDNEGRLENVFSKDALLANVTLYWVTETIHSSMRLYNEGRKAPLIFKENDFVKVPTAIAHFHKEIAMPPKSYVAMGYNVQRWTKFNKGGHFAAMEQLALLAADLKAFFQSL